jgi:hypothetical protein
LRRGRGRRAASQFGAGNARPKQHPTIPSSARRHSETREPRHRSSPCRRAPPLERERNERQKAGADFRAAPQGTGVCFPRTAPPHSHPLPTPTAAWACPVAGTPPGGAPRARRSHHRGGSESHKRWISTDSLPAAGSAALNLRSIPCRVDRRDTVSSPDAAVPVPLTTQGTALNSRNSTPNHTCTPDRGTPAPNAGRPTAQFEPAEGRVRAVPGGCRGAVMPARPYPL